jgi:hypothetical protein
MNHFKIGLQCALCNAPLTLWNANICTHCGRKLCARHAHVMRMHHSYVLSAVCADCSAPGSYAFPKMRAAMKTSAPPPTT